MMLLITLLLAAWSTDGLARIDAQKMWTIEQHLDRPESSHYDPATNLIYVSNLAGEGTAKDGKGWITLVSREGKVIKPQWISGLHAPKGIRVAQGVLWVSDIDRILAYRIADGKKVSDIFVPGSKFLNDVAIAKNGDVYVSDMLTSKIHRVKNGENKATVFVEGLSWESPNGLLVQEPYLRVAAWGREIQADFSVKKPGSLYNINLATGKRSDIFAHVGNLDGLEALGQLEGFVVSDWVSGKVYTTSKQPPVVLLEGLKGSADVGYIQKHQILLVPEMGANKLTAYKLSKRKSS